MTREKQKTKKSKWIVFKSSKIHSKGGFAARDIPKKTKIIEYIGRVISKEEAEDLAAMELKKHRKDKEKGAVYIFELNKKYDIDGNVSWNPARLINHSCLPNAKVEIKNDRIWIISRKKIKKGEEITYDYGYDLENWKDHPCRCGNKNCIGYIISRDEWTKFKKIKIKLGKKKKKRSQ